MEDCQLLFNFLGEKVSSCIIFHWRSYASIGRLTEYLHSLETLTRGLSLMCRMCSEVSIVSGHIGRRNGLKFIVKRHLSFAASFGISRR